MDYEDTSIAVNAGYWDALIHLCSKSHSDPFPLDENGWFTNVTLIAVCLFMIPLVCYISLIPMQTTSSAPMSPPALIVAAHLQHPPVLHIQDYYTISHPTVFDKCSSYYISSESTGLPIRSWGTWSDHWT